MAPTIRVDDEVFDALKERAEAFVDTPNSVLRRVLELDPSGTASHERPKRKRARSGELLHRREYRQPLLEVLARHGGSAPLGEVIDEVGERLKPRLKPRDLEKLPSGMIRWRNRVQWTRNNLREIGLIKADSPDGIWELTEAGWTVANGGDAGTASDGAVE